jgi:hypothetical protein
MAGSRIDALYTADDGTTTYCINVDESNLEMIMGAQVTPNATRPRPPQGFKPRFVIVGDESGLIKRRVPVLTPARFAALTGATALTLGSVDSDDGTSVRVFGKTGEKQSRAPRDFDSGRTDGD